MGDNLKGKMLAALKWSSVDRFGQQAVQFVIGIILARLLTPDDFGLLGLVMIFAALSFVLVESGFGQALIRKEETTELDYNSVFYTNVVVSIILYVALFFLLPFISIFFNEPSLTSIGRVLFFAVIFNGLYLVPYSKLGKVMDFKTIAKVNLMSSALSGTVGVVFAILNFNVWALVFQQVSFHFFRMILFYVFVKWKPKLIYSFRVIKEFWSFSVHLLGTGVLNVIFNYLYILILGKFYPKSEVGYYSQANKLNETFNFSFQAILVGSTYSLFSSIQNDEERFRRVFREIAKKTSLVTFPIMLVLVAVSEPFIITLLSEKWHSAILYFQLLGIASLFSPIYTLNMNALNSRGKSKATFQIEFIKKALIVISVLVCFQYGIPMMLIGYIFACFTSYLVSVFYLKKHSNHYVKHQLFDILPNLILGVTLGLIAFSFSFLISNYYLLLATQGTTVLVLYISYIYKTHNDLYLKSIDIISQYLKKLRKN